MVVLGLIAFAVNWTMAWVLVRGHHGPLPLAIMTAATTGITFAMGIVIALGMIRLGFPPATSIGEAMDVAVYFGLPAAAWASWCASHRNRQDAAMRPRRSRSGLIKF